MNIKRLLVDFVVIFAVTLLVSLVITSVSNLIVRGVITLDWEASLRSAILFGIIFSWIGLRRGKGK